MAQAGKAKIRAAIPSAGKVATPRAVDHLVLPVRDLETARARHAALGFTVAPDARHPFGTENACVFLADGTYLEPLAIGHRETREAAAIKGNAFVARDQAWRFRNGTDGFSAIAMATQDAKADQNTFSKRGISGGRTLGFSRRFDDGRGNTGEAAFELAFAADLRSPDMFMFTCERRNQPSIDRSSLQRHANGSSGIVSIAGSEQNPSDFQYFLEAVVRQRELAAHSFGIDIKAENLTIEVFNSDGMRAWFGVEEELAERGIRLRAVVFRTRSLAKLRDVLTGSGVAWREVQGRVLVDPAPGQGAIYAFQGGSK